MPPAYVKPYVKRGKTDAGDAEAICEAVCRPTMRFVPVKTAAQQSEAMVLKIRNAIVRQRNQTINALRAHLSEFGIVAGVGIARVADLIAVVRDTDDTRLAGEARAVLAGLAEQLDALSTRLRQLDEEIILQARQNADMRRLEPCRIGSARLARRPPTSRPAVPGKMASSSRSTPGCATNSSTARSSTPR